MISRSRQSWLRLRILLGIAVGVAAAKNLRGQGQEAPGTLREKVSRAGVFFRADAPAVLRNADDPSLPIFLEMINGVEKTAHTTGTSLAQYIHRDPLKLEGISLFLKPAGKKHQFVRDPLRLGASQDFSLDLRQNGQPLTITDRVKKVLEIPLADIETYLKQRYLGGPYNLVDLRVTIQAVDWPSQDIYLRVRLHGPALPEIPHWYRGDVHYHSAYTDNPAERGGPLNVTKQIALHSGLSWVVLSDHSTDLNSDRFEQELREVKQYRDGRFVFMRGEELTVASNKETFFPTIHLLALPSPDDPDKGFPEPSGGSAAVILTGDGSLSSPALPIKEALRRITTAGGFGYAAHPFDPVSPLVRGGKWDLDLDFLAPGGNALQPGVTGLEVWNRATKQTGDDARDPYCMRREADPTTCFQPDPDADEFARLEKGIDLGWRPLLTRALGGAADPSASPPFKVFLAAGSDAHGDFNYEATMDAVDIVRKPSRVLSGYAEDNALGKLSTVVSCPEGMGPRGENVLRALREGRSIVSNGPLVIAGFDVNSNGRLDDPEDVGIGQDISSPLKTLPPLQILWTSSPEFGPLASLRLVVGSSSGESKPQELSFAASRGLASDGLFGVDLRPSLENTPGPWVYVRLEARTRNTAGEEFRCYTNPVWVRLTER